MTKCNSIAIAFLAVAVFIVACATAGSYGYTKSVSNNVDDLDDHVENARNAVNPVTVPEDYGRTVIHPLEDDDDDGTNSDDDDDDDTQDTAMKDPTVVGQFVVGDLVDKHGTVLRAGHMDSLVPVTVYNKNVTVVGAGSVVSPRISTIRTAPVCASETAGIARGDVVGYDETCLRKGFATHETWPMALNTQLSGVYKFGLGANRTGTIYANAAGLLALTVETSSEDTNQVVPTTEATLSAVPYTFTRDCGKLATPYPGAPDHFVTVWEDQAGSNGMLAATCRIDAMLPLTVTCTAVPVQLNAGVQSVPVFLEHIAGTEFALTYADAVNGLSVVTISSVSATLATTFNAPLVLDAAVTSTSVACRSYSSYVRGNQIVTAYVNGAVPLSMQSANLIGTTFASAGPATVLNAAVTDGLVKLEPIGASQAVLGFNDLSGSYYISVSVMTVTVVGPDLSSISEYPISTSGGLSLLSTNGDFELTAIDEDLVSVVYFTNGWGFTEYAQIAALYFEGAAPKLVLGEKEPLSSQPVAAVSCARVDGASTPSFLCSITNTLGFIASSFSTRTSVGRTCPATSILEDGRCIKMVHNAANRPVGIATSDAAAGETLSYLSAGDMQDGSIFDFDHKGDVCLHCDGRVSTSPANSDIINCVPHCACETNDGAAINCRNIYTSRQSAFGF